MKFALFNGMQMLMDLQLTVYAYTCVRKIVNNFMYILIMLPYFILCFFL